MQHLLLPFLVPLILGSKSDPSLLGTWKCNNQGSISTWTFGPKNHFVMESGGNVPKTKFVKHEEGAFTYSKQTLHAHASISWTSVDGKKSTSKPHDLDVKLHWLTSTTFAVQQDLFVFAKQKKTR